MGEGSMSTRKRKPKRHAVSKRAQALLLGLSRGPIYARVIHPWQSAPSERSHDTHDRLMRELEVAGLAAPIADGDPSPFKKFRITAQGQELEDANARAHAARVARAYREKGGY
jgi:hypothetical protein